MNREIKFRAWDTFKKMFVPQGEIIFSDYGDNNIEVNPNCIEYIGDDCHNGEPQRSRFTIIQFTGLKDKKGKEIYEGDIWKFTSTELVNISTGEKTKHNGYRIGTIEYLNGRFVEIMRLQGNSFYGELPNIGSVYLKENIAEHIEIIGNIYENPELLSTS